MFGPYKTLAGPSVFRRLAGYVSARATSLFFMGVCLFFFLLPIHADASGTIALMTALGVWAGWKGGFLRSLLSGPGRVILGAFACFFCVALFASILNPETFGRLPRALLWGCCIVSGMLLSRAGAGHNSAYLWALCAGLAASFVTALVVGGYHQPGIWHDGRLKLFAIHPSRLALYCAVCFFFLLHRVTADQGPKRLLAALAATGVFFLLYKTNTRGNLLMVPLGVLCLAATLPRKQWKPFAAVVVVCLCLGAVFFKSGAGAETEARLVSAVTNLTKDPNFKSRLPIWEAGWEAFKAAPLTGHGMHSYRQWHATYTKKHHNDLIERYGSYEPSVKQAHNLLLGRLVEVGGVGTAAFLLLYLTAIVAAWKGPEESRWIVAPLVFYAAMSMLDDGLFRVNDAFILFLAGTQGACPPDPRRED